MGENSDPALVMNMRNGFLGAAVIGDIFLQTNAQNMAFPGVDFFAD